MKLARPEPIVFERADGTAFRVEPCTRAQMRAALALDPEPGEVRSLADAAAQRALQLAALVGPVVLVQDADGSWVGLPSGPLLDDLTWQEEIDILGALMTMGHGQDPAGFLALQQLVKKKGALDALIASGASMPTPPPSPANSESPTTPPSATASSPA